MVATTTRWRCAGQKAPRLGVDSAEQRAAMLPMLWTWMLDAGSAGGVYGTDQLPRGPDLQPDVARNCGLCSTWKTCDVVASDCCDSCSLLRWPAHASERCKRSSTRVFTCVVHDGQYLQSCLVLNVSRTRVYRCFKGYRITVHNPRYICMLYHAHLPHECWLPQRSFVIARCVSGFCRTPV